MTQALDVARRVATWGDVPIGAVILGADGEVLSELATNGSVPATRRPTRRCWLSVVPRKPVTAGASVIAPSSSPWNHVHVRRNHRCCEDPEGGFFWGL